MDKVALKSYLSVVICPDFLAPVCTADEVPPESSSVEHLLIELAVHKTRPEDLKGSPSILRRI